MKRIAFATGSRADYGIMRRYLDMMNRDENIELEILATGALLSEEYGRQVKLIYEDGFKVAAELELELNSSSNCAVLHTMAQALDKFADYFSRNRYDLLIILGDRYEMLSVATAAAMQQIPILHLHGGEATFGNYDEFIRHCITKMGLYHFTATEEYRQRVIQLGEAPERVFWLGALGAENCLNIDLNNVPAELSELSEKQYFVILFHPETLTGVDTLSQTEELLAAVEAYSQYGFVFLGANADTNSDKIRKAVKGYVAAHDNARYYENLHTDAYHYLLKRAICLIGNSSSGIIEAPSLGIYTINIGDRQTGRTRGNSVIDVRCVASEIEAAIGKVLDSYDKIEPLNPYYKENTAKQYYDTTLMLLDRLDEDTREPKKFYDLDGR